MAQRLVMGKDSRRVAAVEVMLNTPHIGELIKKGDVVAIKEAINAQRRAAASRASMSRCTSCSSRAASAWKRRSLNADSRANLEAKINFG